MLSKDEKVLRAEEWMQNEEFTYIDPYILQDESCSVVEKQETVVLVSD